MANDIYGINDIRKSFEKLRNLKNIIKEEAYQTNTKNEIPIPNDERFAQTINELKQCVTNQLQGIQIKFEENPLYFYPNEDDIIMSFTIADMNNMTVNFKLNDSNGQGCYISCNNTQLNDDNAKHIQQIKYAFDAWKKNLLQDASIISNIKSALVNK